MKAEQIPYTTRNVKRGMKGREKYGRFPLCHKLNEREREDQGSSGLGPADDYERDLPALSFAVKARSTLRVSGSIITP